MSKTIDRLELLSPEKRALLALKAKQQKAKRSEERRVGKECRL